MNVPSTAVTEALDARHRRGRRWTPERVRRLSAGAAFLVAVAIAWQLAQVDLVRLVTGLPKVMHWLAQAWPPAAAELPIFMLRMAETVAIAFLGTLGATALAAPFAVIAARGITPLPWARLPLRWLLNAFRGVDSFVFALVLVAAVGLGPFAGVLGVLLHTWGSAGKLLADQIETMPLQSMEALEVGGAGRLVAFRYAMVPELLPSWASISLYLFEFNVRASTVLGVVGAGGIGQELKASMDLLDFARLATIIAVILVTITLIDTLATWTRQRLK
jgi:phosphonate transport system permease protein